MKVVPFKSNTDIDKDTIIEAIKSKAVKEVYCLIIEDGLPYMITTHDDARSMAFASQTFTKMASDAIDEMFEDEVEQ